MNGGDARGPLSLGGVDSNSDRWDLSFASGRGGTDMALARLGNNMALSTGHWTTKGIMINMRRCGQTGDGRHVLAEICVCLCYDEDHQRSSKIIKERDRLSIHGNARYRVSLTHSLTHLLLDYN